MTDLFIIIFLASTIVTFGIEILQSKTVCKNCLTGDKNYLFLTVTITFLGIHLLIIFSGFIWIKIWIVINLLII